MSYHPDLAPSQPAAQHRWHRRRPARLAVAGITAAGVALGGALIYSSANASESQPPAAATSHQAVQQALQGLTAGSLGITLTRQGSPQTITVTTTPQGTAIGFTGADGAFDAAVLGERLYLKVRTRDADALRDNPMTALLLSGHASIAALLDGKWVSLDISEGSPVLSALADLQPGTTDVDPQALPVAGRQLADAVREVAEDLAGPLQQSVADHMSVVEVTDAGVTDASTHYRADVAIAEVRAEVGDEVRAAAEAVLSAWDEFLSEAGSGAQLPGGDIAERVRSALEKGMDEDVAPLTADVWVVDGRVTRIVTSDTTVTFATHPTLAEVTSAVSMDDDLISVLPLLAGLGSLGEGTNALGLGLGSAA